MRAFSASFTFYCTVILTVLAGVKIIIISTRILIGEWPASVQYLLKIVEWDKETEKIAVVILAALVLALVHRRR